MSASNVQPALSNSDWHFDLPNDARPRWSVVDSGIDDPVSDTGLGPRHGDLQLSDEFARLLNAVCEGSRDFS